MLTRGNTFPSGYSLRQTFPPIGWRLTVLLFVLSFPTKKLVSLLIEACTTQINLERSTSRILYLAPSSIKSFDSFSDIILVHLSQRLNGCVCLTRLIAISLIWLSDNVVLVDCIFIITLVVDKQPNQLAVAFCSHNCTGTNIHIYVYLYTFTHPLTYTKGHVRVILCLSA